MVRFRHTDSVSPEQLELSRPVASRRTSGVEYAYVTSGGEDLTVQSPPQTTVVSAVFGTKRKACFGIAGDEDGQAFFDFLHNVDLAIADAVLEAAKTWRGWEQEPTFTFEPATESREQVGMNAAKDLQIFSSTDRTPLTEKTLKDTEERLTSRLVRFIARLDGVYIQRHGSQATLRPVWTVIQLLVYPESCPNPLGREYCFLDDADYESLDEVE